MNSSNMILNSATRRFIVGAILILLVATGLRAYHLGRRSLWLDEAIAANISRGTLGQTLAITRGLHTAPIVDPLILYVVEKVSVTPIAVRIPSVAASLLAVLLMLCLYAIPSIGPRAAALGAFMLAVSAMQIRYAQEVREYSLGVAYAVLLIYLFLSYVEKKPNDRSVIPLSVVLFFAPLVQYGLVLFGAAIIGSLVLLELVAGLSRRETVRLAATIASLFTGSLISLFLTLRYQYGEATTYLDSYYFSPETNLLRFVIGNTHHVVTLFLPGVAVGAIAVATMVFAIVTSIRARTVPPVPLLAFVSCGIVLTCSLFHVYPYGGTRQCLFLAPILCLFASTSVVMCLDRLPVRTRSYVLAAVTIITALSGALQIRSVQPYAEIEDIQPVLTFMRSHLQPTDNVYVYSGAVPAVDFYIRRRDPLFLYDDFHREDPQEYAQDVRAGVDPSATRLWIIFSHIYGDEDRRILKDLSVDWKIQEEVSAKNSALYLASRPSGPAYNTATATSATGSTVAEQVNLHSSFWAWNVRNFRQQAQSKLTVTN